MRNRLENDFPNLEFHRPSFRRNSYIVYVREYTPGDIMEQGDFNISESDSDSESDCCVSDSDAAYRNYGEHSLKEIYTTALSLRNKIQEITTFFENWPPTSTDFSMEKVKSFIPPLLFNFLAWVTNKSEDPETEIYVKLPTSDEHSILSIAQDLVYCTHRGRKPTPKAMALGMAVRQLTGSEKLINLLSGLGHCVSHSSVLRLDSSLAEISIFANSELPQNVITGKFATIVVDNADFAEEVKKQTHITNMILIQNTDSSRISSREVSLKRNFRKSIDAPEIKIPSFNLGKKETPKFIDICKNVVISKSHYEYPLYNSHLLDMVYTLINSAQEETLPDWTGFNTLLCKQVRPKSSITYLPIINASPTEYSTLHTFLQKCLRILQELKNPYLAIVCDEAIYAKIQQIRWKNEDFEKLFIVRLGEFHAIMSFCGAIAKRFKDSGFQVLIGLIFIME